MFSAEILCEALFDRWSVAWEDPNGVLFFAKDAFEHFQKMKSKLRICTRIAHF